MAMIRVDTGTLRSKAAQLRQMANDFKSRVNNLESDESSLYGMWDGQAHDAFHNAFISDKNQFLVFYNGILDYARTLENFASDYERREQTAIQVAKKRDA